MPAQVDGLQEDLPGWLAASRPHMGQADGQAELRLAASQQGTPACQVSTDSCSS